MQQKNIVPPQSLDSERACLGAILIDPGFAFNEVIEIMSIDDFYSTAHRTIFRTMAELNAEQQPIDTLTLSELLKEKNLLDECGGASYIAELTNVVPTSGNVKYYAKIVRDKAQLRNLMSIASEIYEMATSETEDAQDIVDQAETKIFSIAEKRSSGNLENIRTVLQHTIEIIEARVKNKGVMSGVPSGFKDLDNMTYGFQPSDLIILAARPSMGKTALALNMASNMAIQGKKSVLVFSLEMSKSQLVQRILSSEATVDSNKLRSGFLDPKDWKKLLEASGRLSNAKIWIEDSPGLSYMDIRAVARRLKAKEGLDCILIDYLQLLSLPMGKREENRQNSVAEISRNLKMIAREMECPVISLSQLSRAVESRSDKEPMLSDLRESGAIEQDADVVAFIHRPAYYLKDVDEELKNLAEIIIAKQRNGPVGKVRLSFRNQFTRFEDYVDESRFS